MRIGGFQKQSLQDYPGKIAAIIFTQGCNFRCHYCHNPELVLPEKMEQTIPEEYILRHLKARNEWLEGVVITGGEPTIHKDLPELIAKIKALGYEVKLDTNGTNTEMVKELIKENLIDYVAMDLKAPLQLQAQQRIVGDHINEHLIEQMRKTKKLLQESGIKHEFRTTAITGIHNAEELIQIGESTENSPYYLQRFRPEKTLDPEWSTYAEISEADLQTIQKHLQNTHIRA